MEAKKTCYAILGWISSMGIAEWNMVVGIAGGIAVLVYTSLNIWITWRDKIRGRK